MKRFLTLLMAALAITVLLDTGASAASYGQAAQELSAIGMFRGTAGGGFELDRAPTRSEAAIMLVRLYGAEDKAKAAYAAGEIRHPFTDVSDFVAPYAAWLYTNGIVNGTSTTTFGSGDICSLKNYVVFLLRALGYKDNTDFTYAQALDFAQTCGFYNDFFFSDDFLRDDLAALTYQALAVDVKGGETSLLESLIASGSIDATAAQAISSKIGAYRALLKACDPQEMLSSDMDLSMKAGFSAQADQELSMKIDADFSGNSKIILSGDPQMAFSLKGRLSGLDSLGLDTGMGSDFSMDYFLRSGVLYYAVTTAEGTEKLKMPADLNDLFSGADLMQLAASSNVSALAMIKSVTAQTSGGETVYTVTIDAQTVVNVVNELLASFGVSDLSALGVSLDVSDIVVRYTVADRIMKRCDMDFKASARVVTPPLGDTPAQNMTVSLYYTADLKVNATGSAVVITYPDFSDYQEVGSVLDAGDIDWSF